MTARHSHSLAATAPAARPAASAARPTGPAARPTGPAAPSRADAFPGETRRRLIPAAVPPAADKPEPFVPLPIKPTAAMLAQGARTGGVSVEVAWRVYRAMVEAAERQTG